MPTYEEEVLAHRELVNAQIEKICTAIRIMMPSPSPALDQMLTALEIRGEIHDESKFSPEERPGYEIVAPKMRNMIYMSEEYKAALTEMQATIRHHYRENRHHPEHFAMGVMDMHLIDVIEMVCDWVAANKGNRTNQGLSLSEALTMSKNRFHLGDQLFQAIAQTVNTVLCFGEVGVSDSSQKSLLHYVALVRTIVENSKGYRSVAMDLLANGERRYEMDPQLFSILRNTITWLMDE